ncbi:MAG: hypothetical protein ABJF88_10740 [Rhodothermales bacterium]
MLVPFLAALFLATVHVFAGKLRFLDAVPRSVWLSGAGGASVAYVFLHLLPELAHGQETLAEAMGEALHFLDAHVWILALVGLSAFYGLDKAARESEGEGEHVERGVFWLHVVSFGLYNAIIGYLLLHREDPTPAALATYTTAMALHFVVNDYGLRQNHPRLYHRIGRWLLGAAVVAGWVVAALVRLPEPVVVGAVAFLGGGVILNVMKEELPEDRKSRFLPFAVGATLYAALLAVT